MMPPAEWLHAIAEIFTLIMAVVVHAFWMGKKFGDLNAKFGDLNSKIDLNQATLRGEINLIREENEHCSRDRHRTNGSVQAIYQTLNLHDRKIAVLEEKAT